MRQQDFFQISRGALRFSLWLLLPLLGVSLPAHAGLGATTSDSAEQDRAAMHGTLRSVETANYTMHEITAENGVTVHEYASPSGTIFAVVYTGPALPYLKPLLGSYFDRVAQAQPAQNGWQTRHRPVAIDDPDFVLHISGRMRAYRVVAYLPNQLPPTVHKEEIQ